MSSAHAPVASKASMAPSSTIHRLIVLKAVILSSSSLCRRSPFVVGGL
jgi:hypothetical protein